MTLDLGRLTRRTVFRFLTVAMCSLALAGGVHAQGNVDTDEQRTTPVPHRSLHGRLGDAEFQIALADRWNGGLVNRNNLNMRQKPAALISLRRPRLWPGTDLEVFVPWPTGLYLRWRFGPEWRTPKAQSELGARDLRCLKPLPR